MPSPIGEFFSNSGSFSSLSPESFSSTQSLNSSVTATPARNKRNRNDDADDTIQDDLDLPPNKRSRVESGEKNYVPIQAEQGVSNDQTVSKIFYQSTSSTNSSSNSNSNSSSSSLNALMLLANQATANTVKPLVATKASTIDNAFQQNTSNSSSSSSSSSKTVELASASNNNTPSNGPSQNNILPSSSTLNNVRETLNQRDVDLQQTQALSLETSNIETFSADVNKENNQLSIILKYSVIKPQHMSEGEFDRISNSSLEALIAAMLHSSSVFHLECAMILNQIEELSNAIIKDSNGIKLIKDLNKLKTKIKETIDDFNNNEIKMIKFESTQLTTNLYIKLWAKGQDTTQIEKDQETKSENQEFNSKYFNYFSKNSENKIVKKIILNWKDILPNPNFNKQDIDSFLKIQAEECNQTLEILKNLYTRIKEQNTDIEYFKQYAKKLIDKNEANKETQRKHNEKRKLDYTMKTQYKKDLENENKKLRSLIPSSDTEVPLSAHPGLKSGLKNLELIITNKVEENTALRELAKKRTPPINTNHIPVSTMKDSISSNLASNSSSSLSSSTSVSGLITQNQQLNPQNIKPNRTESQIRKHNVSIPGKYKKALVDENKQLRLRIPSSEKEVPQSKLNVGPVGTKNNVRKKATISEAKIDYYRRIDLDIKILEEENIALRRFAEKQNPPIKTDDVPVSVIDKYLKYSDFLNHTKHNNNNFDSSSSSRFIELFFSPSSVVTNIQSANHPLLNETEIIDAPIQTEVNAFPSNVGFQMPLQNQDQLGFSPEEISENITSSLNQLSSSLRQANSTIDPNDFSESEEFVIPQTPVTPSVYDSTQLSSLAPLPLLPQHLPSLAQRQTNSTFDTNCFRESEEIVISQNPTTPSVLESIQSSGLSTCTGSNSFNFDSTSNEANMTLVPTPNESRELSLSNFANNTSLLTSLPSIEDQEPIQLNNESSFLSEKGNSTSASTQIFTHQQQNSSILSKIPEGISRQIMPSSSSSSSSSLISATNHPSFNINNLNSANRNNSVSSSPLLPQIDLLPITLRQTTSTTGSSSFKHRISSTLKSVPEVEKNKYLKNLKNENKILREFIDKTLKSLTKTIRSKDLVPQFKPNVGQSGVRGKNKVYNNEQEKKASKSIKDKDYKKRRNLDIVNFINENAALRESAKKSIPSINTDHIPISKCSVIKRNSSALKKHSVNLNKRNSSALKKRSVKRNSSALNQSSSISSSSLSNLSSSSSFSALSSSSADLTSSSTSAISYSQSIQDEESVYPQETLSLRPLTPLPEIDLPSTMSEQSNSAFNSNDFSVSEEIVIPENPLTPYPTTPSVLVSTQSFGLFTPRAASSFNSDNPLASPFGFVQTPNNSLVLNTPRENMDLELPLSSSATGNSSDSLSASELPDLNDINSGSS